MTTSDMSCDLPWPQGSYYARPHFIGGCGGTPFTRCEFAPGDKVVRRLGVHWNSQCLLALRITWSDGTKAEVVGRPGGNYKEIRLDPRERILTATLWGNGIGTRTGRIQFTTDRDQTLDVGKNTAGQDTFPMDVGSGILAGFAGRAAWEIDVLSFIFLDNIASAQLTDVKYGPLPTRDTITSIPLVSNAKFSNHGKTPIKWTFANSVKRTETTSFSSEWTMTFGSVLSVSAGVPGIAEVGSAFHWEVGTKQSTTATSSTEISLSWDLSGDLAPGETIMCSAGCQYGNGDVTYEGTLLLKFQNGTVRKVLDKGVNRNSRYGFATAEKNTISQKALRGGGGAIMGSDEEKDLSDWTSSYESLPKLPLTIVELPCPDDRGGEGSSGPMPLGKIEAVVSPVERRNFLSAIAHRGARLLLCGGTK